MPDLSVCQMVGDVRRFAPEEFLTLHPWEGRCRALAALWVYFLIWKDLKQSAALSGAAGLPE